MTSEGFAWLLVGALGTGWLIAIRKLRQRDRHIVRLNGPIPSPEEGD